MQMKHPSKSETSRHYFETPMKHPIVKEKVYTFKVGPTNILIFNLLNRMRFNLLSKSSILVISE